MDTFFDINRGSGEEAIVAVSYNFRPTMTPQLTPGSTKRSWNEYWSYAARACRPTWMLCERRLKTYGPS